MGVRIADRMLHVSRSSPPGNGLAEAYCLLRNGSCLSIIDVR
jgi:hypothetical protein